MVNIIKTKEEMMLDAVDNGNYEEVGRLVKDNTNILQEDESFYYMQYIEKEW